MNSKFAQLLAWVLYDFANGPFSAVVATFILPPYFIRQIAFDAASGTQAWGLTLGLTGLFIAVLSPLLGALADQEGGRKGWIGFFTALCVLACAALWFALPHGGEVFFVLALFSLGTIGSEFAFVFYNSMLPMLAPKDQIGFWSGWGWGMGYLGGVFFLGLAFLAFVNPRTAFVGVALWYALFSIPFFILTPSVPSRLGLKEAGRLGFKQLISSLKTLRKEGSLLRFFLARMCFVDGLITLFAFGGLFAAAQFGMEESSVLLFGISLNVTAGIGSLCFSFLDDRWGSKNVMTLSLVALIGLGIWGINAPSERQFWIAGLLLGLFVGPVQASSRAFLAKIAPPERSGELFGFFTLSGRVSSFCGPLLLSFLVWLTGSLAWGMGAIPLLLAIGLVLLLTVEKDRQKGSGRV